MIGRLEQIENENDAKEVGWGHPQRAGDAHYPVRTEPLPTALNLALSLKQSFSIT
jgi:hypothetical protein